MYQLHKLITYLSSTHQWLQKQCIYDAYVLRLVESDHLSLAKFGCRALSLVTRKEKCGSISYLILSKSK